MNGAFLTRSARPSQTARQQEILRRQRDGFACSTEQPTDRHSSRRADAGLGRGQQLHRDQGRTSCSVGFPP
jgi:hypothetical protein